MIDFVIPKGLPRGGVSVRGRLGRILDARGITTARVTVAFSDDNGPKGGRAMRCVVDVALPRRAPLHAEHTAPTPQLALEGAIDIVERDLERLIKRRRDAARRPKKYYAAKRLLSA